MKNKILVIDDEKSIRKSFELTFEDTNYHIDTVDSGMKGIQALKRDEYSLVFLDLKMPEMDGVETLREIRKVNKEVVVYIVTAFHEEFFERLKDAARQGQNFEILQKPVSSDDLLDLVDSVLMAQSE